MLCWLSFTESKKKKTRKKKSQAKPDESADPQDNIIRMYYMRCYPLSLILEYYCRSSGRSWSRLYSPSRLWYLDASLWASLCVIFLPESSDSIMWDLKMYALKTTSTLFRISSLCHSFCFYFSANDNIKKSTKATFDLYLEQAQANVARWVWSITSP